MTRFTLHTIETAPGASQENLLLLRQGFGFIPNLFAKMAESPLVLQAYLDLRTRFEKCSLTPAEQQVVALAASVEHGSEFCVSAHSVAARHQVKLPPLVLNALREGGELPDLKLNVLAKFTRKLIRQRGQIEEADLSALAHAGYLKQQMLDVVLGVTLKTLGNYVCLIAKPPLNEEFAAESWTHEIRAAA